MAGIDLGADDGFLDITLEGCTQRVDLWLASTQLAGCAAANQEKGDQAYGDAVAAVIEGLGFPAVSHRMALRFAEAVAQAMREIKKKDETAAASPASTASIPAA